MGSQGTLDILKARHKAKKKPKRKERNIQTTSGLLLTVARTLSPVFTLNQLVVACYKADQERFGLKGYRDQYPDSNTVSVTLHCKRGPLKSGKIVRVRPGEYRVAEAKEVPKEFRTLEEYERWQGKSG